jgi:hypothetical protein
MGYFIGELLKRKVVEYEFTELHGILASIADGSEVFWPAEGYAYSIIPAYLESARIVLYSMLHHHRLKKQFVVKTNYSNHTVFINKKIVIRTARSYKAEPATKRASSIFIPSASNAPGGGKRASLQDVPAVPEDLDGLMAEDITLDTPVGNTGTAPLQSD